MKDLSHLFNQKVSDCPLILGDSVKDHTEKLSEAELALINDVSNQEKRNEFLTGRFLLKEGLKSLKFSSKFDILREPSGAPLLPERFIGSISHTNSFAVACVKEKGNEKGVGIDVESISRVVNSKIIERYLFKDELKELPFKDENEKLIRLFSAKEAYYKAINKKMNFNEIKLYFKDNLFICKNNKIKVLQELTSNSFVISLCISK